MAQLAQGYDRALGGGDPAGLRPHERIPARAHQRRSSGPPEREFRIHTRLTGSAVEG